MHPRRLSRLTVGIILLAALLLGCQTSSSLSVSESTPALAQVPTPGPTRTPRPGQTEWRGDLHMHTTCSDGHQGYEEMVQKALALNLDFIAITDHRFDGMGIPCPDWGCNDRLCAQVVQQCRQETRLVCIPGAEIIWSVHVLALGIQKGINAQLPVADQVQAIHRQGGIAVAAHPLGSKNRYGEDQLLKSGFDAMECGRTTAQDIARQQAFSQQHGLPCLYDSDAHNAADLGRMFNVCSVPINNIADLKAALIGGKCKVK